MESEWLTSWKSHRYTALEWSVLVQIFGSITLLFFDSFMSENYLKWASYLLERRVVSSQCGTPHGRSIGEVCGHNGEEEPRWKIQWKQRTEKGEGKHKHERGSAVCRSCTLHGILIGPEDFLYPRYLSHHQSQNQLLVYRANGAFLQLTLWRYKLQGNPKIKSVHTRDV